MKHTEDVWTFVDVNGRLIVTAGKKGFVIAEVTNKQIARFIGNDKEAIANAKLIAAAPDLLKVCIDILADDEMDGVLLPTDRVRLKNAIYKATI